MIAILTPSRGRPARLREMIEAARSTASSVVRFYVGLDSNDPALGEYLPTEGAMLFVRPRMRLAQWTNALAEEALADGCEILGFLGDDHRMRTPKWDEKVRAAFEKMGSGLVFGADGLQNHNLPTAPFWSADVVRILGFYYPPVLMHLYADNYWLRLAQDLQRVTYLPDFVTEHMHPAAGKADYDDVYRENDAWYQRDALAYEAFVRDEHPAILERVRAAIS